MKKRQIFLAASLMLVSSTIAWAGPNDFFNSPGSAPTDPNAVGSPLNINPSAPPGDFSSDEKHMQKKYQINLRHAHDLIQEGEDMKAKGEKRKDDKMTKKGKILMEIGQKELTDLQTNNPYATMRKNDKSLSN